MSTGSISEEEVVEVSSDEEMDKVIFNKEEMDKVDKKKDEDLRIEEAEEPRMGSSVGKGKSAALDRGEHQPWMVPGPPDTGV